MVPISENDKAAIEWYIRHYAPGAMGITIDDFLREWAYRKKLLYKLLGKKLFISLPMEENLTKSTALGAASILLSGCASPYWDLCCAIRDIERSHKQECLIPSAPTPMELVENRYASSRKYVICGKEFCFAAGDRVIKAYQKLWKHIFDFYSSDLSTNVEMQKRVVDKEVVKMSDVIALAKANHKIVLSIHPLDFLTMSDNEEGWTSCMSLKETGCYNIGSYEMMNSPNVLCAYIIGNSKKMHLGPYSWNSKVWRQLFIVDRRAIIEGKPYPRINSSASQIVLDKILELAKQNLGWDDFGEREEYTYYWRHNQLRVFSHGMYNDYSNNDSRIFTIALKKNYKPDHIKINYSGKVYCIQCGRRLNKKTQQFERPTSSYICERCSHTVVGECAYCRRPIYGRQRIEYLPQDIDYSHPYHHTCISIMDLKHSLEAV